MAIKRPTKSRGTPLRRPVSSAAAVRHIEVRPKHQMVAGELYEGWLCKNSACGLVIALALLPEGSKSTVSESDDHLSVVKCPHCGNEDLYRWNARAKHAYAPKSAGAAPH